jgi:hypothetical protein
MQLSEFGRRGALLAGSVALSLTVIIGILAGGDLVKTVINGAIAAFIFGLAGFLIGNLFNGYVMGAANREAINLAVQREMQKKAAHSAEKVEVKKKTIKELDETP